MYFMDWKLVEGQPSALWGGERGSYNFVNANIFMTLFIIDFFFYYASSVGLKNYIEGNT